MYTLTWFYQQSFAWQFFLKNPKKYEWKRKPDYGNKKTAQNITGKMNMQVNSTQPNKQTK